MRTSAKVEYACLATMYLAARADAAEPVPVREIAAAYDIPQQFLVQILLQLKTAGYVASTRGTSGGYRLARPADTITLGELMGVMDRPDEDAPDDSPNTPGRRVLREVWSDVARKERELLGEVTVSDLVARAQEAAHHMYFI